MAQNTTNSKRQAVLNRILTPELNLEIWQALLSANLHRVEKTDSGTHVLIARPHLNLFARKVLDAHINADSDVPDQHLWPLQPWVPRDWVTELPGTASKPRFRDIGQQSTKQQEYYCIRDVASVTADVLAQRFVLKVSNAETHLLRSNKSISNERMSDSCHCQEPLACKGAPR